MYGPVRTVVWQGSAGDRRPYADQVALQTPPIPRNEEARPAILRQYEILDTEAEKVFDDITALAASVCETPISLVTFIDRDRQWIKSNVVLPVHETGRDAAFCGH